MREILFRGKRCDNGEWVQGYYIRAEHHWHKHGIHKDWITLGASANGGWFVLHNKYAVKAETVGQFTGLTDKNGKKIFEGDIIKIPDDYDEFGINAGEIYEVYFAFGGFRLKPKYSKAKGFWLEDDKTVEVIGNIHDNPKLLKNP
jgi:uncharacterized phage protein (TIGR01671 family)